MRDTETPEAARRRLAEPRRQSERPASAAHPRILWVLPEGALAVGASVSNNRDLILIEVYYGLLGGSALCEDLCIPYTRWRWYRPSLSRAIASDPISMYRRLLYP